MTPIVTPARVIIGLLTVVTFSEVWPQASPLAGALLALVAAGYLLGCAAFPYRKCRACRGMGRHTSGLLGGIRLCRRCDGDGLQLRAGRRMWNAINRHRRRTR